jgi:predicted amidohydrolase
MRCARSIAAAQTIPIRGDAGANIEQHVRLVHAAADEQAEVLVFPELSLTGYEIELANELAFSERDARLAPLVDAASSCAMTVIAGAPVRIGADLHIGAFILSPDRGIELYTKQRLGAFSDAARRHGVVPPAEATVFRAGSRNPLVQFGGNIAAIAVCADIEQPAHPQDAADRGAKTYLASMFVTPSGFEGDTAKLRAYAARHAMTVVLSNFGGPSGRLAAAGGSAIWSETGELVTQLGSAGAGVAVAFESADGWRARTIAL